METLKSPDYETAVEAVYLILKSNYKDDCVWDGNKPPKQFFIQEVDKIIYYISLSIRENGNYSLIIFPKDNLAIITRDENGWYFGAKGERLILDKDKVWNICNHIVTDYNAWLFDQVRPFFEEKGIKI